MGTNAGYTQMGSHPVAGRARAMRGCDAWSAKPEHLFIVVPDTTGAARRLRDTS